MNYISEHFKLSLCPESDPRAIVAGKYVRFTVLTSRLLRMEFSPVNKFENRPSQAFWYRNQPVPEFKTLQSSEKIEIMTEHLHLTYKINEFGFSRNTLSIEFKDTGVIWKYGDIDNQNLKGTARTLDEVDGSTKLENGLISRNGWSIVDDSGKVVFDENGWIANRFDNCDPDTVRKTRDIYFFGYGSDYKACQRDFCKISGQTPLFPRWVLGNWWSRYHKYTQEELTDLMQEFEEREIPLSVCIVDMDWHVVENDYHPGWTGYTWNKNLFPDHIGFIKWLHDKGLKTALNLHPALGVHPHEEKYRQMAEFMDIDPESKKPIDFDISDPQFAKGYFEILHNTLEDEGVDFWWLDWQQGTETKLQGLDPLSWLNHLHFLDLGRGGSKRSFIFSRYGGLGNHRYPIGFSGDSIVSWESLAFQPYFTSTASNVGYGWWSHDIGGHMSGIEDSELFTRWVQYGVFSPVLRLHSTNNPYNDRRPWAFDDITLKCTKDALQLRHSLIPYLYTMLWRNNQENVPAILPMYYEHPEKEEAYHCNTQYYFGTELVVSPYVQPKSQDLNLSRQTVWLPEGQWFNFFTGEYYEGNNTYGIYGDISEIPVFAKAGGIIPLAKKSGSFGSDIPTDMELFIFPGKSNIFELYEDDGETLAYQSGKYSLTNFSLNWSDNSLKFEIHAPQGETRHLPNSRSYRLILKGIKAPDGIDIQINGKKTEFASDYDADLETLTLSGIQLGIKDNLVLSILAKSGSLLSKADRTKSRCIKLLKNIKIESWTKLDIERRIFEIKEDPKILKEYSSRLTPAQSQAILETILGGELISLI